MPFRPVTARAGHATRLPARVPARVLLGSALAVAAACSSNDAPVTDPGGGPILPVNGPTHVRIVNVVSDATAGIDVSANGARALGALPYAAFFPAVQGEYQSVAAAPTIAIAVTGAASPFYNQVPSAFAANAYATAFVFGRAGSNGFNAATVVALSDTGANAPSAVLVRVFNAADYIAPGARPAVDVYVYPQGGARPATPTVAALTWGAPSPYITQGVGTLQVDVFKAGSASAGAPLFTGTVSGAAGSVRTLVLRDPAPGAAETTGAVLALFDIK